MLQISFLNRLDLEWAKIESIFEKNVAVHWVWIFFSAIFLFLRLEKKKFRSALAKENLNGFNRDSGVRWGMENRSKNDKLLLITLFMKLIMNHLMPFWVL